MINLYCTNLEKEISCEPGTTLAQLAQRCGKVTEWPILAAIVDNQLKELSYPIYDSHNIQFIDYSHPDGARTYFRSLSFVLQKAVSEIFENYSLSIEYNMQNGMYVELKKKNENGGPSLPATISEAELNTLKNRMQGIIDADLPFVKRKVRCEEALELFRSTGREEKALLHQLRGRFFTSVYFIEEYPDHYYGPLLYSTGALTKWDLDLFSRGFMLKSPSHTSPYKFSDIPIQYKLFDVFKEHAQWCNILGVRSVGSINKAILDGKAASLIQISEALHERKYSLIADEIYRGRDKIKLILVAGPSSSGKTTSSKRVALQAKVLGLQPVIIEMDNYFVNREDTPLDSDGNFDFETIKALDINFLKEQLNALFEGERVELPKFNFSEGRREFDGTFLSLGENDILIMEGIHALNPLITSGFPSDKIYKLYVSALTSLALDENNSISTSDSRLLRRIVRDNSYRGASAEDTILRWPSVRRGEIENIFPYQENSQIMFNSAMLYELSMLKYFVEPLLRRIPANSPASVESIRLLKFLSYIRQLQPSEIAAIPPTSVMREFIGGSSFIY
ncbi:MAG: nucleoside kinase [Bacteroidales bacterium]